MKAAIQMNDDGLEMVNTYNDLEFLIEENQLPDGSIDWNAETLQIVVTSSDRTALEAVINQVAGGDGGVHPVTYSEI